MGEEVGLAEDGTVLGVDVQVVVLVMLVRLEDLVPDQFALRQVLLELKPAVLLRLQIRLVLLPPYRGLDSVLALTAQHLELLLRKQLHHAFFLGLVQLLRFRPFLSDDDGLLVLRFVVVLGEGVFLGDMAGLFVEAVGEVSAEEALGIDDALGVLIDGAEVVVVDVFLEPCVAGEVLASSRWTLQTWQGMSVCVGRNWSSKESTTAVFSHIPLQPLAPMRSICKYDPQYNQKSARAVTASSKTRMRSRLICGRMLRHQFLLFASSLMKLEQSSIFSLSSACFEKIMREFLASLFIQSTTTSSSRMVRSNCCSITCDLAYTYSYFAQFTIPCRYRVKPASRAWAVKSRTRCLIRAYSSSIVCRNLEVLSRTNCSSASDPSIITFTLLSWETRLDNPSVYDPFSPQNCSISRAYLPSRRPLPRSTSYSMPLF